LTPRRPTPPHRPNRTPRPESRDLPGGSPRTREFVEFVARGLVDEPDAVQVEEERWRDRTVYHLAVAERDMGKVIGKGGKIAHALRTMLKVAALRDGARVSLDIG
jgi:uncharacterized protein